MIDWEYHVDWSHLLTYLWQISFDDHDQNFFNILFWICNKNLFSRRMFWSLKVSKRFILRNWLLNSHLLKKKSVINQNISIYFQRWDIGATVWNWDSLSSCAGYTTHFRWMQENTIYAFCDISLRKCLTSFDEKVRKIWLQLTETNYPKNLKPYVHTWYMNSSELNWEPVDPAEFTKGHAKFWCGDVAVWVREKLPT